MVVSRLVGLESLSGPIGGLALNRSWFAQFGVTLVAVVFDASTLATMLWTVLACQLGLQRLPLGHLKHYAHALAGAAIALCGMAIQYLGL